MHVHAKDDFGDYFAERFPAILRLPLIVAEFSSSLLSLVSSTLGRAAPELAQNWALCARGTSPARHAIRRRFVFPSGGRWNPTVDPTRYTVLSCSTEYRTGIIK